MGTGKITVLTAFILFLASCTSLPPMKPVTVGGLVFHNETPRVVQDVRLQVSKTGRFITCNMVLPGSSCATTFPSRQYRGGAIVISWRQAGQAFSSGKIQIRPQGNPAPGKPTTVLVTIKVDNSVNAFIEQ